MDSIPSDKLFQMVNESNVSKEMNTIIIKKHEIQKPDYLKGIPMRY